MLEDSSLLTLSCVEEIWLLDSEEDSLDEAVWLPWEQEPRIAAAEINRIRGFFFITLLIIQAKKIKQG